MPQHFKAEAKNFDQLFTGQTTPVLNVPEFQRGYSWESKHVEAFWKDLTEFMEERKKGEATHYFLGPIVLLDQNTKLLHILDGQQRLATATILFSVIRDTAKSIGTDQLNQFAAAIHTNFIVKDDAGEEIGYTLTLGNLDKDFFRETVQRFPPTQKAPEILSHRNICTAKSVFSRHIGAALEGKSAKDVLSWLKDLRGIVREFLVMTCIPVENEREAFKIFETLNDRGLTLSAPDLLLNYLMKMAPEKDRVEVREHWDVIIETMAQRKTSDLLRAIWVSQFGDLKKQDLFSALKGCINASQIESVDYAKSCAEQCETYANIIECDSGFLGDAEPYVRALMGPLGCSVSAMPLLLSASTLSKDGFMRVAGWLTVFAVRYSEIAGMDQGRMESLFFALARKVRELNTNAKEADGGKREKAAREWVLAELKKECPSDSKIQDCMDGYFVSPKASAYMVKALANAIQSPRNETGAKKATVEHIFPKHPSADWKNAAELQPYLRHIGNLTLLGKKMNEKESANNGYDVKKAVYSGSQITMTSNIPKYYTEWTVNAVIDRGRKIGEQIVKIWRFENLSGVGAVD